MIKVGDKIYVKTSLHISSGSLDVIGGLATVSKVSKIGEDIFVDVLEHPQHSYNWAYLSKLQSKLKKEFGKKKAYPDPDIDTPWIEEGDFVNGEGYHGRPQW